MNPGSRIEPHTDSPHTPNPRVSCLLQYQMKWGSEEFVFSNGNFINPYDIVTDSAGFFYVSWLTAQIRNRKDGRGGWQGRKGGEAGRPCSGRPC